jgi:hypothetical protein
LTIGNSRAAEETPTTATYLFKEHREGKNGGKILVPVLFSESPGENEATDEGEE